MSETALAFQDVVFDVVDRDGVPWLRATQIAQALGYAREDEITRLYSRHVDEFTENMTQVIGIRVKHQFGVLGRMRIFSPRGFHLLALLARTPVAKAFRAFALDLIEQHETPFARTAPDFSPVEQAALSRMPEEAKGRILGELTRVACERPHYLGQYLDTALKLYLKTAEPAAIAVEAPEPVEVAAFWDAFEQLVKAGHINSHSASPSLIAVNLPEFIRAAREQGYYSFERAELVRLLPLSRRHALLKQNKTLYSPYSRKALKCWVFRKETN